MVGQGFSGSIIEISILVFYTGFIFCLFVFYNQVKSHGMRPSAEYCKRQRDCLIKGRTFQTLPEVPSAAQSQARPAC